MTVPLGYRALLSAVPLVEGLQSPTNQGEVAWMNLTKTPRMGFNSWNRFGCDVSDPLIREMADAMVKSGMKDTGYQYIVIYDCWQVERDAQGAIVADPKRLPSGTRALAEYVHSKGLKFGIYSDAGSKTCQGRPGSNAYEIEDARQCAAWGVDYRKYDWCSSDGVDAKIAYPTMRNALKATGRPIVFSICEWGQSRPWTWTHGVGHLWRTTGDIQDCYHCIQNWGGLERTRTLDKQVGLEKFAGPGGWNDPDMLEVGNGGMSTEECRAHFSFWCLLAAPLMAGNDLCPMSVRLGTFSRTGNSSRSTRMLWSSRGPGYARAAMPKSGRKTLRPQSSADPLQPGENGVDDCVFLAGNRFACRCRTVRARTLERQRPGPDQGHINPAGGPAR